MSVPSTEPPVQGNPAPPVSTDPQETQSPYAEYLAELPESVRPLVEPVFKKWDAGVTQRFQELHSQQEPWKPVLESYQPDDVVGALEVAQILEQDPVRFLQAFSEAYPELIKEALKGQGESQQPQPSGEQGLGDLDPDDPVARRIAQLEQQLAQVTGTLTEQQEQDLQQQQQTYLDEVLKGLHEQHGDFDDTFILAQLAYANRTPEQAIQAWNETKTKFGGTVENPVNPGNLANPTNTAPSVIPSNGGVPSTSISAEELDPQSTRALVAQLLEQAAKQESGN